MKLSDRIYNDSDAALWVIDEIEKLEDEVERLKADAERYRFITEDHADSSVRAKIREILNRLPVMSYAAASAAIDAARGES